MPPENAASSMQSSGASKTPTRPDDGQKAYGQPERKAPCLSSPVPILPKKQCRPTSNPMSDRATPPSCRLQSDTPKLSASASIPDAGHRPSHVDANGHNAPHSVFRGEAGNDPPLHHATGGTPPRRVPPQTA